MRRFRSSRHIKKYSKTVPRAAPSGRLIFYSLVFARIYKLLYELIGVLAESDYARPCVGLGKRARGDKRLVSVACHELRERRVRGDSGLAVRSQKIIYKFVVCVAEIVVVLISDEPCRIGEGTGGGVNEQVARKIFVCAVRLERRAYGSTSSAERAVFRVDEHIRLVNAVVVYRDRRYRISHAHADGKTVLLRRLESVAEPDLNAVVVAVGELGQSGIFASRVGIESLFRVLVVVVGQYFFNLQV